MNDFDFLAGTWDVPNRWRADFLDETSAWEEFPAFSRATRHFDGAASFDEIIFRPIDQVTGADPKREERYKTG